MGCSNIPWKTISKIHFISVYSPCKTTKGTANLRKITAYAQQAQILRVHHGKYYEPHKAFVKDLSQLLTS